MLVNLINSASFHSYVFLSQKSLDSLINHQSFYSLGIKTMAGKEESKTVQFIEEWALVMEAKRTISSKLSNVNRLSCHLKANLVYLLRKLGLPDEYTFPLQDLILCI